MTEKEINNNCAKEVSTSEDINFSKSSTYLERAKKTLYEFSVTTLPYEQTNFKELKDQWEYTGNVEYVDDEVCQLCGKEHVMWIFKIINKINKNTLWVGSECIKKFEISDNKTLMHDVRKLKKKNKMKLEGATTCIKCKWLIVKNTKYICFAKDKEVSYVNESPIWCDKR